MKKEKIQAEEAKLKKLLESVSTKLSDKCARQGRGK